MLGFSLGKILLFAALVALIWYGFKYMGRVEAVRRSLRDEIRRRHAAAGGKSSVAEVEDLSKCGACGAYVAARGATPCGRPDCPWGR
jgi:hypothetical protein